MNFGSGGKKAKGKIISHIPEIFKEYGWTPSIFAGHMMILGASPNTAYKLANGNINCSLETLMEASFILGRRPVSDLIEFVWDDEEKG